MNVCTLFCFAMCVGFMNNSTKQYTRTELYALGKKCKHEFLRPPADIAQQLEHRQLRRTRGCRGGKHRSQHRSSKRNVLNRQNLTYTLSHDAELTSSRLALINARSLKRNMQSIKHFLFMESINIACISETWLHEDDIYAEREVCSMGYSMTRFDRPNRGGGVALLYRNTFKATSHAQYTYETFEHVHVHLTSGSDSAHFISIYRPPQSNEKLFLADFTQLLENIYALNDPVFIIGDFNVHVDNVNSRFASSFLETIAVFGMQQHVNKPTHIQGHTLDLLITREGDRITATNVSVTDLISDHYAVTCNITMKPTVAEKTELTYRKINDINIDQFKEDLRNSELIKSHAGMNLQELVDKYDTVLVSILDKHAPIKTKTMPHKTKEPWYDEELHTTRKTLRQFERRWKSEQTENSKHEFLAQKNVFVNLIKTKQSTYYNTKIEEIGVDQSRLFMEISKIMHRGKCNPMPPDIPADELPDAFNDYFATKISNIRERFSDTTDEAFEYDSPANIQTAMTAYRPLSEHEIYKILMASPNKSCELDPIPTSLLKTCSDLLIPVITRIVNLSLEEGRFPAAYKTAIIRPLLKKPSLEKTVKNYRPVSNLSFISKLIEEAVCIQLREHIVQNNLAEKCQSAYRKHHSTETALLKIFNDILLNLDKRQIVYLNLLDLSAAFDTLDHDVMIQRLRYTFGINGIALKWFESYLTNRSVKVCVNKTYSKEKMLSCSAPQGSKLGPRMYSDYTKPLGNLASLLALCYHFYADDTQLYKVVNPRSIEDQFCSKKVLEDSIACISEWMYHNKLKLNQEKTEFIIFSSNVNCKHIAVDNILLGTATIPRASTVRNLGVYMDMQLNMMYHINDVKKRCFYYMRWIWGVRHLLTTQATKYVVHALVISRLDYCNSVLYGLPKCAIHELQLVLNAAARLVTRCSRDTRIKPILMNLHWLPVEYRIQFKTLCLAFKGLHNQAPEYITDMLSPYEPSRRLRSSEQRLLTVPRTNLKYGTRAFSVAAPSLWNSLPPDIRATDSYECFKKMLKTHLFRVAFL